MIGDSYKDIVPANELGMSSLYVLSGNGKKGPHKFDHSLNQTTLLKTYF